MIRFVDDILCLKQFGVRRIGTFSSIKNANRAISGTAMHHGTYLLTWCSYYAVPLGAWLLWQLRLQERAHKRHKILMGCHRVPLYRTTPVIDVREK